MRTDFAAGFERWAALLRHGLQAMHRRGELGREADPDALALSLLAAAQGGALLTQTQRDLRRADVFPAGDVGLRAAIQRLDGLATVPSPKQAAERARIWSPFRSYAAAHLWLASGAVEAPPA